MLDTVCVGGVDITGNEDSDECLAKGGQLVKVKNKTTKIKLELIPEEQSSTDAISQRELYYNKDPHRVPKGTIPSVIQDYNSSLSKTPLTKQQITPQTTIGMTYPIATSSNNLLQTQESDIGISSQTTTPMITANILSISSTTQDQASQSQAVATPVEEEHPSILDENNAIVSKCRRDAMHNSIKIASTTPQTTPSNTEIPTTTNASQAVVEVIYEYRSTFYGLLLILLLVILSFVGYKLYVSSGQQ